MKKWIVKMIKPLIKKQITKFLEDEDNQHKYIEIINKKLDIPNMDEAAENILLNQVYDALQVAIIDIIEEI